VISTWASWSEALSRQAVSWLANSGSGPLLQPGMYPSAMAQRVRPIGAAVSPPCSASSASYPGGPADKRLQVAQAIADLVAMRAEGRRLQVLVERLGGGPFPLQAVLEDDAPEVQGLGVVGVDVEGPVDLG
jgi:hypothetical protein